MREILIYSLILALGIVIGFLLKRWLVRRAAYYNGTIYVKRDRVSEKVVYSLVLDDYPETLEFKKVVIFKVDSPEEKSQRK